MSDKGAEEVLRIRNDMSKVSVMLLSARKALAEGGSFDFGAIAERIGWIASAIELLPISIGNSMYNDLQILMYELEKLLGTMQECLMPAAPVSTSSSPLNPYGSMTIPGLTNTPVGAPMSPSVRRDVTGSTAMPRPSGLSGPIDC